MQNFSPTCKNHSKSSSYTCLLKAVIHDVVVNNNILSWIRLLAFPYIVLNTNKGEKEGQNAIRFNLNKFGKMTTINAIFFGICKVITSHNFALKEKKSNTSEDITVKSAMRKISEGDF